MRSEIRPGLLVLHGNRLEDLRDAVSAWLARSPLEPLEQETFLVQSNGSAEWLKMSLAAINGISAASRVELPARFLWRAYRQMLGPVAVPAASPFEKSALVWRVMRLLPSRLDEPAFKPVARFLVGGDFERRLQLAERVADLYDQYQVYRADWLEDWAYGRDVLRTASGVTRDLPSDQLWQAALWRDLLGELGDTERRGTRATVHRAFLAALARDAVPHSPLPRRVVLFGTSHVPGQTLEALAALSRHAQVLLAIPNPCRFHWADITSGRELMRTAARRHALRGGRDLATVPLEAMHAHSHPLLAAWGRQGRDFMRQLDAFDDVERSRDRFNEQRLDLFDDGDGETMLGQVQAAIRDLVPLAEQPVRTVPPSDRSIVFHIAHNPQREVEVLHDQLLALLAAKPFADGLAAKSHGAAPLKPRDIVVMVPDIDTFAPAIRAVFGQHATSDPRRIPFGIVDLKNRGNDPLVVALEWLLRAPSQRYRLSEVKDLLEVPAIARRFGLEADDLPQLSRWMEGAGARWGLAASQRAGLGLDACGAQNTWAFGLRRMLLGYASGVPFEGVDPYDEIRGLDARLVGALADLIGRLEAWWRECRRDAPAREWASRGRALLAALVDPDDEAERLTLAAAQSALAAWLGACELASFDEPVSLAVFREAWLAAIDPPGGARRFLAGGVTFCTLMPLRAVPFEVVCLLGMNDLDFPRPSRRSDFDLMALPGQPRAGDRSRRDDDRYLMLEALLSARRVLYVSWSGRSPRDNSEQPASVLVSQLRDHLRAVFRGAGPHPSPLPRAGEGAVGAGAALDAVADAVAERTTEHPLQPFSSRYFDGRGLVTYAREWRSAHVDGDVNEASHATMPPFEPSAVPLTIDALARFLKNPVKAFFRQRLDVAFHERDDAVDDDEAFGLDGLARFSVLEELVGASPAGVVDGSEHAAATDPLSRSRESAGLRASGQALDDHLRHLIAAGRLPIGETGLRLATELRGVAEPMRAARDRFFERFPHVAPPQRLQFEADGTRIDDWLDGLQTDGVFDAWLRMRPSVFHAGKSRQLDPYKLIDAWVRTLVASACDQSAVGWSVGCDVWLVLAPIEPDLARAALRDLLAAWREGMNAPLPLPAKTAIAFIDDRKANAKTDPAAAARLVYEGGNEARSKNAGLELNQARAEGEEPCLARCFADFDALSRDNQFAAWAERIYRPMLDWMRDHVQTELHATGTMQVLEEALDG